MDTAVQAPGSGDVGSVASRARRAGDLAGSLAVVVGVAAAYWPVVTTRYAFSDDYPLLWMAVSGRGTSQFGSTILETHASEGRPVGGVLKDMAYELAGSIDGLRFVRMVGLLGVLGLALLLQWWLRSNGLHAWYAAVTSLVVCVTPVFSVMTSWAVLAMAPLACGLGGVASVLATLDVAGDRRLRLWVLAVALSSFVLGFLIYPPAAMFFWVFFIVAVLGARSDARRLRRVMVAHGLLAMASLAVSAAASFVSVRLAPRAAARMALVTDPFEKVGWFVTKPLYRSLTVLGLPYNAAWAAVVGLLVLAGIGLVLARRTQAPALAVVAGVAAIPLSFLPNLVVAESNSFIYRSGIALTSTLVLLACLGALGIVDLWKSAVCRAWPQTERVVAAGIAVAATVGASSAVFVAHRTVTTFVTEPQARELAVVREAVRRLPDDVEHVTVVRVPWESGPQTWVSDELGLPSTAQAWTADALVYLALDELGRTDGLPSVVSVPWWLPVPPGEVIDVREGFTRDQ